MKKMKVEGKVAFVSGANRGIGKAVTLALLEHGAKKVYAGARDIKTLNSLKSCYGDQLVPVELDVTNNESIANAANLATDVEILINNAGGVSREFLKRESFRKPSNQFRCECFGTS